MSDAVGKIVDYLRKRDNERVAENDGGAFDAAADEIEGLGSLWGALATSRTQTLTDTPPISDLRAITGNVLGRLADQGRAGLRAIEAGDTRVAARAPGEDGGQRSREAAESTGIKGGSPHSQSEYLRRHPYALKLIRELEKKVAQRNAHLDAIRARLRIECAELGDNSWPDGLHLADVIDRYLCRPVRDQIQSLENEVGVLRDRERDAGQQLLAESDRMAKLNGDLHAEVNALREEVRRLADRERDVERGVVAEIAGWLRYTHLDVPGDVYAYAQVGAVNRAAEILAEFVAGRIERGDWRAQPQPQPQPTEPDAR